MKDGFAEYSLAELVADPLIGLLMKSDGVDRRSIEVLFEQLTRARGGELFNALPKEATCCTTF
ncbi:MAG: hypothetical protein WA633_04815 [Stellaceae bacterium]